MENEFLNDGFEDFLRESSDECRMHPSDRVWAGIQQKVHAPSKWPYIGFALLIFGLGMGTGLLLQDAPEPKEAPETESSLSVPQDTRFGSLPYAPSNAMEASASPFIAVSELAGFRTPSWGAQGNTASEAASPFEPEAAYRIPDSESLHIPTGGSDLPARIAGTAIPLAQLTPAFREALADAVTGTRKSAPAMPLDKPAPAADKPAGRINPRRKGLQLHITPSVSYRRLTGQASDYSYSYSGLPYAANYGFAKDVNDAVIHKPGLGMEIGASLVKEIGRGLRIKGGLQLNMNNYEIEAYRYLPEMASLSAATPGGFSRPVNAVSYFRNFNGFSKTWLRNTHFMVSIPVGLELSVPAGRKVSFHVGSNIQPTYVASNRSYLISTNLKNYAQEPSLYRRWNVNAGAEAYVSVNTGSYRWIAGPQVRYQLLSSYKENYPIRENLFDYGIRLGIQKTLR